MSNILIIEDNKKINDLISLYVKQEGYKVYSAFTAEEGLELYRAHKIDLIVTDLMLPGMSGEDFVEEVRRFSDVYIIILTAKIHLEDKIMGLKLGADDYLVKPFSTEELLLKIKNFLKRKKTISPSLSFYKGEVVLDEAVNVITFDGSKIELTANEHILLVYLATHRAQIFSREQLLDSCFGNESEVFDRIIDVYIKNIRKKLKDDPKKPRYIKTIYGLGYMFVGEIDD